MSRDTEDRLRKMVVEHLGAEPADVVAEADMADDLGADSVDPIEIGMAAEEEFDITLTDDDTESVKTFGDLVAVIDRKLRQRG